MYKGEVEHLLEEIGPRLEGVAAEILLEEGAEIILVEEAEAEILVEEEVGGHPLELLLLEEDFSLEKLKII